MRIIKISILNYMGIGAFVAEGLGRINLITGKNGVGKSAVLKAITEGFKSSGVDPDLVKIDSEKAEILIELDGNIEVMRRLTARTNTVKVTHDGRELQKPQEFLTGLFGRYNFNPVEFFQSKRPERRQILLRAIPATITRPELADLLGNLMPLVNVEMHWSADTHVMEVLDRIQEELFNKRAVVNQDLTRMQKSIQQDELEIPETFDTKEFEGFDQSAAVEELDRAMRHNSHGEELHAKLQSLREQGGQLLRRKAALEAELAQVNQAIEEVKEEGTEVKAGVEAFRAIDTVPMKEKINRYDKSRKLILKLEAIKERRAEMVKTRDQWEVLDSGHKRIVREAPKVLLRKLDLGMDDVVIDGESIRWRGVDIDKLSTSEQLLFALNIARRLAGPLKVVCIDRFESLDEDTRKAFEKHTEGDGIEYFVTSVSNGPLELETIAESVKTAAPAPKQTGAKPPKQTAASPGLGF